MMRGRFGDEGAEKVKGRRPAESRGEGEYAMRAWTDIFGGGGLDGSEVQLDG